MSNSNLTIDMVTKEVMRVAHEKATFIGTVDRSYDDSFSKTGAKIGSTLRVRKPNQYTRRQGSRVMNVQDQLEPSSTITVATQDGVDMRFNSAELSLEIDEFSKRYIEPAVSVLVSGIDGDAIAQATKDAYQYVGTAGTVVGTVTSGFSDTSALGQARAKLNQALAPKDGNRAVHMDSVTMASVANGIKGLFQPTAEVERAWRDGFIAHTAMADFYENERTYIMANSAGTTPVNANDTIADGATTLTVQTTTTAWAVGQVFTVAGIYACHPETKQSLGTLAQFTIRATSTATVLQISPTIYITGARKNVCTSTGADISGAQSGACTLYGAASTSYRSNLMLHKEAFAFVTADLPLMDDAVKCVRMNKDGLALRVWQGSDIRNDELLMRVDCLYGFKTLRPEWMCRILN